jgi:microcystin-dependent protein
MSEPFVGEIRAFGFNFAPRGWALCQGQIIAINSNTALFSLLGTTYGGDGRTTFGLPDLRGRAAMGQGTGPGLTPRHIGQMSGYEYIVLNTLQIPSHSHAVDNVQTELRCSVTPANQTSPVGNSIATNASGDNTKRFSDQDPVAPLKAGSVALSGATGATGGSQQHSNMQPWLAINYSIALLGLYPSRN